MQKIHVILTVRNRKGVGGMDNRRVLIADSDPVFCQALARTLQSSCEVCCCGSGMEALALLETFCPGVLVLDLTLRKTDGFSIIQAASIGGTHPVILATTPFINSYIVEIASALNVTYMMRRPCDVTTTAQRVADLLEWPQRQKADNSCYIDGIMQSLGFNIKQGGYQQAVLGVTMLAENPGQSMTKELYPALSKCSPRKVSGKQVEKLIRYAIRSAWDNGDQEKWACYFPRDHRPSNGEFITRLAEILKERERKYDCMESWSNLEK